MRPPARGVTLLTVGLFVGAIFGYVGAGAVTTTLTTTSLVPTTLTKTETFTQTETRSEVRTTTQTQTVTARETLTISVLTTQTFRITETVTTYPTYSPTCRLNEQCGDAGLVITAYSVDKRSSIGMFKPKIDNVFLVIDIKLKNVKNVEYSYSQLFMKVKDEENHEYATSVACTGLTGYLPGGGKLLPGEEVRGYVCFEVPSTSQNFIFKYEDFYTRIDIKLS
jgi:hypothetical protein